MANYKVKAGDNLWDIGEKLFGDGRAMKRIMYLNNMTSSTIRPGQVLKLPTIVKGRNDRFRITNADIERQRSINEKYGGTGYGLATTGEIAAGNYGGAGYGGGDVKKPPVRKTLAAQGIDYQDTSGGGADVKARAGAMTSLQAQYAGQYVKPSGITGGFVDSNKDAPFKTPAGVSPTVKPATPKFRPGPSPAAQQYIPDQFKPAVTSNTNAPFRTPATIGFTTENRPQPQTPQEKTAALGQNILNILGEIAGVPQTVANTVGGALGETVDAIGDAFNPPPETGSFYGIENAPEWLAQRKPPPEVAETGLIGTEYSGSFSDASIRAWKDFENPHTGTGYNIYLDQLATKYGVKIKIPGDVVTKNSGFGYTVEQMREMGYTYDIDSDYFVPYQGDGEGEGEENPLAGNLVGSGVGGQGGFGGGGGGGGYPNRVGTRSQNGVTGNPADAAHALFKGYGSWKGANFG